MDAEERDSVAADQTGRRALNTAAMINPQQGREATDVVPWIDAIYLDHQATTPLDARVAAAMAPWLGVAANPHATEHAVGRAAADAVEQGRGWVAALLGCRDDEVTFTSGATEASNIVLRGLVARGDRLVVSAIEHPSVSAVADALALASVAVGRVGVDAGGILDMGALEAALAGGAALASVMQVSNEVGTVQPIAEIAASCADAGVPLHTDLTQGAGRVPSPLTGGQVDYASLSAHKVYGPQGIGALFVRRGARMPAALAHGGGQERGLRPGTVPVAAAVGFGKACEIALAEMEADAAHAARLQRTMLAVLSGLDGWHVNGSLDQRVPHNLSLTFAQVQADALIAALPGVALASGSACSGGAIGSSPTLRAIGLDDDAVASTVRVGFGRTTTEAEVVRASCAIADAVRRLRRAR